MANPHKGEVEIKLNKSISKGYLKPKGPITLKYDYNALADAELEFRSGESLLQVLSKSATDPAAVSFHDMRVILAYGLKHQFPTITKQIAGSILNEEKFSYVVEKLGEAIGLALSGNITSKPKDTEDEFVRGAEELSEAAAEDAEKN